MKNISSQILLALLAGTLLGVSVKAAVDAGWISGWGLSVVNVVFSDILNFGGYLFITALKLLVVPLVLVSLVNGVCSLSGNVALGRIAGKTFGLYLISTAVAVVLALLVGNLINPGEGVNIDVGEQYEGVVAPSIYETLKNMMPSNPFAALASGNMIQIILFALLLGLAIRASGDMGERVAGHFSDWNAVVMRLVGYVIGAAPYGVFCLLATLFAVKGIGILGNLAAYFINVLLVLAMHFVLVYGTIVVLAKLNPIHFLRNMLKPLLFSFSTASSGATIPVSLDNARQNLGVSNSVASFTIPLGATINMDGTAIMQGVATVFIAGAYMGVDLTMVDYFAVILTATLASIGTAGVPSVGLIMLTMVLTQVGLPVEGVALIIGIDRLLDMARTTVNITGDAAISCLVARTEGQLDDEIFNRDPV